MLELQPSLAELTSARTIVRTALHEDLQEIGDLTSQALISAAEMGTVRICARQPGVLSGLPFAQLVFEELGEQISWQAHCPDGTALTPGSCVASLSGPVRTLLTGERTVLNLLTMLSGTASLTAQYVAAVAGTKARILDTRKTLPGLRLLQKYAVRCGGGTNHRMGLYDAILIKDNHLAAWQAEAGRTLAGAVRQARSQVAAKVSVTIEVDTLEQLADALQGGPDIVLLDNMSLDELRAAVAIRDNVAPEVLLEASGGVNLQTVGAIARTGVDRISVGALTHSAPALDLGFDWG